MEESITVTIDDIAELVREIAGYGGEVDENTTLQHDAGVYGDDMSELLDEYSRRFNVDMSRYRWYFHTGEEGWNIGSIFFKSPDKRVKEIPITFGLLRDFANSGAWLLDYPEHCLPKQRIDLLINRLLLVSVLIMIVIVFANEIRKTLLGA